MQKRTIEDIFDKEIGNRKFAKFITLFKEQNIEITDIREFYETFRFKADGYEMEYRKDTKDVKEMFQIFVVCLKRRKELGLE